MEILSGTFRNVLDDKCRLTLPAKLRDTLPEQSVVMTKGLENCLWVFPAGFWKELVDKLMAKTSLFNEDARKIQRWFIGYSQEIELDKAGRIMVPQSLRGYAQLGEGRECVVTGLINRLEIWDCEAYDRYWESETPGISAAVEKELGDLGL